MDLRTRCRLACGVPTAVMAVLFLATLFLAALSQRDLSSTLSCIVALGAIGVALAVLAGAVVAGEALAHIVEQRIEHGEAARRQAYQRCSELRELIGRGLDELHQVAGAAAAGEQPLLAEVVERPADSQDPFGLVAHDIGRLRASAQRAVGAMAEAAARDRQAAARTVYERCHGLRELIGRGLAELHQVAGAAAGGDQPVPAEVEQRPADHHDPFELVGDDIRQALATAERLVIEAAEAARTAVTPVGLRADVVGTLALRMQVRIHRALAALEQILGKVEDPDLLEGLYPVDHLVVLLRRQADNLAVIGGGSARRVWTRPVSITSTIRAAVQEIEHHARVRWVPPADGALRGDVVADIIHLLAELVENATEFSPRHRVMIRVEKVTAGLAIEIEDKGLGFADDTQRHRMNELLADPHRISLDELLRDGRIGLWVVGKLAGRHGVAVQLKNNVYGGVLAVVVLPEHLITPVEAAPLTHKSPADAPTAALAAGQPTDTEPRAAPAATPEAGYRSPADPGLPAGLPDWPVGLPASGTGGGVVGGVVGTVGGDATGGETGGELAEDSPPPLPQRIKQRSLVPELRQPPAADGGDTDPDAGAGLAFTAALLGTFRDADPLPADTPAADTPAAGTQSSNGTSDSDGAG